MKHNRPLLFFSLSIFSLHAAPDMQQQLNILAHQLRALMQILQPGKKMPEKQPEPAFTPPPPPQRPEAEVVPPPPPPAETEIAPPPPPPPSEKTKKVKISEPKVAQPQFVVGKQLLFGKNINDEDVFYKIGLVQVGTTDKNQPIYNLVLWGPRLSANTTPQDFKVNDKGELVYPFNKVQGVIVSAHKIPIIPENISMDQFILIDGKEYIKEKQELDLFSKTMEKFDAEVAALLLEIPKPDNALSQLSRLDNILGKLHEKINNFLSSRYVEHLKNPASFELFAKSIKAEGETLENSIKNYSESKEAIEKIFEKRTASYRTGAGKQKMEMHQALDTAINNMNTLLQKINNFYAHIQSHLENRKKSINPQLIILYENFVKSIAQKPKEETGTTEIQSALQKTVAEKMARVEQKAAEKEALEQEEETTSEWED